MDSLVSLINKELSIISPDLVNVLIADITGFEGYVTENNPNFFETLLRQAKAYKASENFDPVKYAQSKMPQDVKDEYDSKVLIASLPMKALGPINSENRADRFSWGCLLNKTSIVNSEVVYNNDCVNPCSNAIYDRKVNIAIDDCFNTSLPRNTEKWQNLYKTRTVCERATQQVKDYLNINSSQIRNTVSLKSTILLAGIIQLIGVLIMIRSGHIDHLRAFKTGEKTSTF